MNSTIETLYPHPDEQCSNKKCNRTYKCGVLVPNGRTIYLCADCTDFYLHLRKNENNPKPALDFAANCHRVIVGPRSVS